MTDVNTPTIAQNIDGTTGTTTAGTKEIIGATATIDN
jgi:hypothetical protein